MELTVHNYKNYLRLLSTISEDKEVKSIISNFLTKVTKDKTFKKKIKSYLFEEVKPKYKPIPDELLEFLDDIDNYLCD